MLTLWNGFDRNFHNELRKMDRLVDGALREGPFRPVPREGFRPAMTAWPRVDVIEGDDALRLEAEVPGMTADDIEITLHEGVLVLEGRLREEVEDEQAKGQPRYLFRERQDLSFKRSFKLGRDLDADNVTASVDNGVLTVVLPKKPQPQPRQIKITTK